MDGESAKIARARGVETLVDVAIEVCTAAGAADTHFPCKGSRPADQP